MCVVLFIVAIVTLVEPVLFMWVSARRGKGECFICGYNLTGNVSGRCPECGMTILEMTEKQAQLHDDGRKNVTALLMCGWCLLAGAVVMHVSSLLLISKYPVFGVLCLAIPCMLTALAYLVVLFAGLLRAVSHVVWPTQGWILWICTVILIPYFFVANMAF